MNKFLVVVFSIFSFTTYSQILDNIVKWEFSQKQISETEVELQFKAEIEENWHLYSQDIPETPPATTFTFIINGDTSIKKIKEPNAIEEYDSNFEMALKYFVDEAIFKHTIDLSEVDNIKIDGYVDFMVCDDKQCLPPDYEEFNFTLKLTESYETDVLGCVDSSQSNYNPNATVDDGSCYLDGCTDSVAINYNELATKLDNSCKYPEEEHNIYNDPLVDLNNFGNKEEGSNTLWGIFLLGLLGGIIALITPCVFPMIPLTVSFFTKGKSEKGIFNAAMYGFFIMLIYFLLSIPFHIMPNIDPEILNQISTNTWLNLLFFVIFIAFALSFFGYYELTLPSKWGNKADSGSNTGGLIGIFFMALTLAIVSFSCTGPILGTLLAGSLTADGGAWQLTAGMAGFGVSLGLPFALFAMFPNMLNALPKSGGWLNTTKVILGFLELALAFKFLSNADLVKHWGLLKIEPFLILWIIIFAGLALYLFGKIKFPHDSPIKKLSFSRIAGGILVAAFAIYLASGFRVNKETTTFTPLTLLSGLAPPVGYSWLYPSSTTNNLKTFKDLKEGIAYAKQVNKPIMIDFTGYACVNCRKMEEHIWPLEKIDNYLRNEYVLISLYVDDKKDLPTDEKVEVNRVNGGKRLLKNYGHKWANFQTQFFRSNSQPYYVLLNSDGNKVLIEPVGYTPDEDEYARFLEGGLEVFNKTK